MKPCRRSFNLNAASISLPGLEMLAVNETQPYDQDLSLNIPVRLSRSALTDQPSDLYWSGKGRMHRGLHAKPPDLRSR